MLDVQDALKTAADKVERGDLKAAEELSRTALRADAKCSRALHILGLVARRTDRLALAISVLRDAAELAPHDAGVHCELGLALADSRRDAEAVAAYRRAIDILPNYGDAALNLAAALDRLERHDEALDWAKRATELMPNSPIAHFNLANVWRALGQLDAASAEFQAAIALKPSFANAHWNLACCRLLAGDFATGWREYGWRERAGAVAVDRYPQSRWQGESLKNQTILVHSEQGIGDEILFASCLPDLIERAGRCVVVCEPRLEKLFARSFPQASIHGFARRKDGAGATLTEPIDKQVPAGSLPTFFRPSRESFPQRPRFLVADNTARAEWRRRFDALGSGLKVGISWRAGGQPLERRKRTTGLNEWREIFAVPGSQFVNLQYGETNDDITAARDDLGVAIHDWDDGDPLVDMDAFAAKIAALDLVISVGNATVHLAGSLGVPTWALLPKVPGWRWMLEGERSPWYSSVRLIRQRERGVWPPVLAEVAKELRQFTALSGIAMFSSAGGALSSPVAPTPTRSVSEAAPGLSLANASGCCDSPDRPTAAAQLADRLKAAADLLNSGDVAAAERIGRDLLAADPRSINALRLMGAVTRQQGRLEQSLDYFHQALVLNERSGLLHFELGTAYTELQQSEQAFECYLQAVQLDPKLQPAFVNLSALMEQHERYEEAIEWAQKAIVLRPDCGLSHYNLANAQRELGRIPEAIESYEKSLRFKPDHAKTVWNLGICHLLAGNFREGWRLFERRQDAQEVFFDRYTQPRWDGSSLAGKTIVVHAEQGIGDEILFGSCFPDLIPLAKRCIFVCDPRLERLLARSFPQAGVYGHLRRKNWSPPELPEPFDVQIPAGSLPLHFRSSPESFPRRERFLTVDSELLSKWRERLAAIGPGLKIGISWRAGGKPLESRKRTIPLDRWAGIFSIPGVQFINLQYGDVSAEIASAKARLGVEIHDWEDADPLIDIDGFAAKIAALDLVISVGNATVHVAGAVGTPAWTLLPMVPSWRWMLSGEQSPWYANVRLLRQSRQDDWGPVLTRVASMLRERVGASAGVPPLGGAPIKLESVGNTTHRWYGPADLAGHKTDTLIAAALEFARRLEESGNLPGAEQKYREALQLAPRHYVALNGLGVVARKMGRTDLAIRCFRRSLAMVDALPVQQLNLADALADAGRFDEALAHYRRAIKLDPMHVAACVQAGRMAQRLARHNEAIEHFQQALAIQPNDEAALIELGHGLLHNGRIEEAIAHGERAVELRPDSAALLIALGKTYCEDQRYADAEGCFRRAIARAPAVAAGHFLLGHAIESLGRREEAAVSYERAIELDGSQIDAMIRLAALRRDSGLLAAAENLLCRALTVRPADPQILNSLGVVLLEKGARDEAIECFEDAIQFAPEYAEAHVNRSLALLRTGRLVDGWAEFEWRWKCRSAGPVPNTFRLPEWNGDSLAGKSILIYGEQALADELLFASCYSDVIEQAARCLIVCDPRLESLFRRSFAGATICPVLRGREHLWRLPKGLTVDLQIAAGSLPKHLRSTLQRFPSRTSYLAADPSAVADTHRRLAALGGGIKIGVAIGGPTKKNDLADAKLLQSLFEMLGTLNAAQCMWVGDRSESAAVASIARESGLALRPWPIDHNVFDVDSMAAGISALDVLIADGGLAAHLAGGLGVAARVLLPINAPWHWFGGADTTVWFRSLRLFRQQQLDSWDEPIRRLREDLLNLTGRAVDNDRMSHISGPHWANRASQTQSTHSDGPN
jgi:tetratricopeptide (TPR) repeat protein/ADP-heptose:LPS heptosyltransferase